MTEKTLKRATKRGTTAAKRWLRRLSRRLRFDRFWRSYPQMLFVAWFGYRWGLVSPDNALWLRVVSFALLVAGGTLLVGAISRWKVGVVRSISFGVVALVGALALVDGTGSIPGNLLMVCLLGLLLYFVQPSRA